MSAETQSSAPSTLVGIGTSLLVAALGSLALVVPAAARVPGVSFVRAWLVLASATALLVGPTAAALRSARPLSRGFASVLLGLAVAGPPLVVFARILEVGTHHRPLGAVTYAIVAASVILGATAFSARLIAWSAGSSSLRRSAPKAAGAIAVLALVALSLPLLSSPARSQLLDAVLAFALLVVSAFVTLSERARLNAARAGAAMWVIVVLAGLWVPSGERAKVELASPVLSGVAGWLRAAR